MTIARCTKAAQPSRIMWGLLIAALLGCGSKYEQPGIEDVDAVQPNLGAVPDTREADIEAARARTEQAQDEIAWDMDSITARALEECTPFTCPALERGELALGMTHAQVLVATQATPAAWNVRGSSTAWIMLPASEPVHDVVGELAMIVLRDGMVVSYRYREPTGLRSVTNPVDAATAGRRRAMAGRLLRDGDDLVAAGRLYAALDKYVEADILDPDNPDISSRIARLLRRLEPADGRDQR